MASFPRFTFGGRGVGLVVVPTAAASFGAAIAAHFGVSVFARAALDGAAVRRGELHRAIAWPLFEPSLVSLLFACLSLWWLGRDLAERWGSRRFVASWFGLGLATGLITTGIGLAFPTLAPRAVLGPWPLASAFLLAWGMTFPDRVVRFFFVLPLAGRAIAWLTVGLTVAFGVFVGTAEALPSLVAELVAAAWLFGGIAREALGRARARAVALERVRRVDAERLTRAQLRELDKIAAEDVDLPPMPAEIQGKLDAVLREAGARAKEDAKNREREPKP